MASCSKNQQLGIFDKTLTRIERNIINMRSCLARISLPVVKITTTIFGNGISACVEIEYFLCFFSWSTIWYCLAIMFTWKKR